MVRAAWRAWDDPAFYHYQLAELARLTGDADLARGELKAGLAIAPDDTRLLLSEARLEAATDRVDDAIAALQPPSDRHRAVTRVAGAAR